MSYQNSSLRFSADLIDILKDELNIKEVIIEKKGEIMKHSLSLDIKKIAKRIPKKIQYLRTNLIEGNWSKDSKSGEVTVGQEVLYKQEYTLEVVAQNDNSLVIPELHCLITLDTHITPKLQEECVVNDLIRNIQESRKSAQFDISEVVLLHLKTNNEKLYSIITKNRSKIEENTLSKITPMITNKTFVCTDFDGQIDIILGKRNIKD